MIIGTPFKICYLNSLLYKAHTHIKDPLGRAGLPDSSAVLPDSLVE
jgi:hypothetical protein